MHRFAITLRSGTGAPSPWSRQTGPIDWLCLPDLDSPSVFAALLDSDRGGAFVLRRPSAIAPSRRYLPGTNVLETTFHTEGGVVRVVDAMTLPGPGLAPLRELARRIEGLAGEVSLAWHVQPRFGYARAQTRIERRLGIPVATSGATRSPSASLDARRPPTRRRSQGRSTRVPASQR